MKLRWLFGIPLLLFLLVTSCSIGYGLSKGFDGSSLNTSGPRIRVIRIEGVISDPRQVVEKLRKARLEPNVRAVVLRIESPGGAVGASQEIYEATRATDAVKPVVASIVNVGASGGYYSALGAREIWANPGSLTASIGVITEMPNFQGLLDKIGVGQTTIKSGEFKDAGSPFRSMTEREHALFQAMINDVYAQFRETVAKRRGLVATALDTLADGRVMSGRQARVAGLIDTLGTFEQALDHAKKLAGLDSMASIEGDEPKQPLLRRLMDPEGDALSPWLNWGSASVEFRLPR